MIFPANSSVLVIFGKRPRVGVGKQRIAAAAGAAAALQLSELLLAATLADAQVWPGPVVIAPADAADSDWAATLLPDAQVIPQQGANLGERINFVDRQLRKAGAVRIVYVGTDAPGHTPQTYKAALHALDSNDVVLLPARDGGVTLLGACKPWPDLGALPWETEELCAALLRTCKAAGCRVNALPAGYDVDYLADLLDAAPALQRDLRPTRRALADWLHAQLKISIVIPVRRDADALNELLEKLSKNLRDGDEILVVASGQHDDCAAVCQQHNARLLRHDSSRGARMNRGAAIAANPVLWFLHADAAPPASALQDICHAVQGGACSGFFRFRFRGARTLTKGLLESCINLRTRLGIPYADQGLFMTRRAFEAAGGFADQSLFEEVALVRALRDSGRFRRLPAALGVSPRRWEKDGWWQRTLHNRLLVMGYWLGIPSAILAKFYRQAAPTADQQSH